MKVLNYLELFKEYYCDVDINLDFIQQLNYFKDLLKMPVVSRINEAIVVFYSQPFEPELITELFAGWRIITITDADDYCICYKNDKNIKIQIDGDVANEIILYHEVFKFPRTLDDFINDCQRAGIELEWKL